PRPPSTTLFPYTTLFRSTRGCIKPRIKASDITINIGKGEKVPFPMGNKKLKWGEVVHNQSVTWLDSWQERCTGTPKYVFMGASSDRKSTRLNSSHVKISY